MLLTIALFLFYLWLFSFMLGFGSNKPTTAPAQIARRITPDLLLSNGGKPLTGTARNARINKLVAEGYVHA